MQKNETTLSICIVTWNSEKYLRELFQSIFKQTVLQKEKYPIKLSVNVVDSGSQDGSMEFLTKKYPEVHVLRNTHNLGFSRSYNQSIRMSKTEYILVINADIVLEEDFIEKALNQIKNPEYSGEKIGAVVGKLYRGHFVLSNGNEICDIQKTKTIDSFGIEIKRNRRFVNIGEGEEDKGQYNNLKEIFGFSGACVMFRRQGLEDVKYSAEYFDEDFFAYKEDIDLSWRLQIAGYKIMFVQEAKAYHFRSLQDKNAKYTNVKIARSYKKKASWRRMCSYRNHLLCLFKNETKRNFLKDFFPIILYEFRKLIYLLIFDTKNFKGFFQALKLRSKMKDKRKISMRHRIKDAEGVRKWITS
ncbi:MAG: glycosyltransferase family 2 protein [Patescibacteria group bacterium]